MNDPFLIRSNTFDRLVEEYLKHGSLIVAVDFDNTLFDYHNKGWQFPAVAELMKDCKSLGFKIVVFTGSAKERHSFIKDYCRSLGFIIDGVNEDVIDWHQDKSLDWSQSKIYFNILLDDRAGLGEAYNTLRILVNLYK